MLQQHQKLIGVRLNQVYKLYTLMELFVCDEGLCDELVVEWMIESETDWNLGENEI